MASDKNNIKCAPCTHGKRRRGTRHRERGSKANKDNGSHFDIFIQSPSCQQTATEIPHIFTLKCVCALNFRPKIQKMNLMCNCY